MTLGVSVLNNTNVINYTNANTNTVETRTKASTRDIECLAKAIYFEARGHKEGIEGRNAVGQVVLNRMNHNEFPSTPCNVIYQPKQFSWVGMGYSVKEKQVYNECKTIATDLLNKHHSNGSKINSCAKNSLFFSRGGFNNKRLKYDCTIGSHKFYSMR